MTADPRAARRWRGRARALEVKLTAATALLDQVRDLHSADVSQGYAACAYCSWGEYEDRWPCDTARVVYTPEEIRHTLAVCEVQIDGQRADQQASAERRRDAGMLDVSSFVISSAVVDGMMVDQVARAVRMIADAIFRNPTPPDHPSLAALRDIADVHATLERLNLQPMPVVPPVEPAGYDPFNEWAPRPVGYLDEAAPWMGFGPTVRPAVYWPQGAVDDARRDTSL